MIVLVVDRSSARPGFAVLKEGAVVFAHTWEGEPSRAPQWTAEIGALLQQAGFTWSDFDQYIGGIGPGSFSGIRGALSFLNGLALPYKTPVYGVSSAAAMALEEAQGAAERVTVIGDARRNTLWVAQFQIVDRAGGAIQRISGEALTHSAEDFTLIAPDQLSALCVPGTIVISPDWARLEGALRAAVQPGVRLVERAVYPSVAWMGRLSAAGNHTAQEPLPIYLHPAV